MILDILENSNYYRNLGYYVSDEVYKKLKKYGMVRMKWGGSLIKKILY